MLPHMEGFMESFFDIKIWWLAVKLSTCFSLKKKHFTINMNPVDFLIVY
jgi:hypothetical protein